MISLDKFVVPVNGRGSSESLNVGEEKPGESLIRPVMVDGGGHLLKENDQNVGNHTLDDRNVEGALIKNGCDGGSKVRQLKKMQLKKMQLKKMQVKKILADLNEKVSDVSRRFCRIYDGISDVDGKVDRLAKKLEQVSNNARNAGD